MLTFRPTKMLAARARLRLPPDEVSLVDPYCDWCAHGFTARRLRYLLLANTYSFLSVVIPGSGITSETAFVRASVDAIQRYLSESGRGEVFEKFVAPHKSSIRWAKVPDRSVMGTMNELIFQAQCDLIEEGLPLRLVSDRLNGVALSVLWKRGKTISPGKTFDAFTARSSGR